MANHSAGSNHICGSRACTGRLICGASPHHLTPHHLMHHHFVYSLPAPSTSHMIFPLNDLQSPPLGRSFLHFAAIALGRNTKPCEYVPLICLL